jgi:L-gulonate 3-dehydrogenase
VIESGAGPVAVVGAGSIGCGMAIVLARAGHAVRLCDPAVEALAAAEARIAACLADLAAFGLLDEPPEGVTGRICTTTDLAAALAGVVLVQECAPEEVATKRELFAALDRLAPAAAILASSSSAIPVSVVAEGLAGCGRCLVAHPANPPFLLPVIELVPAPFTDPATVDEAAGLYAANGMVPVRLEREVEGFLLNRLQGAVLREAYCLVRDGVASVEAVDRVMRAGLGRRWAVIGPFETADLNVRGGIAAHAARMGPAYARLGAERGQDDPWTPDLVARVAAERRAVLPLDGWEARVAWRDRALMALEATRRARPELFAEEDGGQPAPVLGQEG